MQKQMQTEGVSPSSATFVCSMKFLETLDKGQGAHCEIVKLGLGKQILVRNTVTISMYANFVLIVEAENDQEIHSQIVLHVLTETSSLQVHLLLCVQSSKPRCSGMEYTSNKMQTECVSPSSATLLCNMKFLETPNKGQGVHCQIVKLGLRK